MFCTLRRRGVDLADYWAPPPKLHAPTSRTSGRDEPLSVLLHLLSRQDLDPGLLSHKGAKQKKTSRSKTDERFLRIVRGRAWRRGRPAAMLRNARHRSCCATARAVPTDFDDRVDHGGPLGDAGCC